MAHCSCCQRILDGLSVFLEFSGFWWLSFWLKNYPFCSNCRMWRQFSILQSGWLSNHHRSKKKRRKNVEDVYCLYLLSCLTFYLFLFLFAQSVAFPFRFLEITYLSLNCRNVICGRKLVCLKWKYFPLDGAATLKPFIIVRPSDFQ